MQQWFSLVSLRYLWFDTCNPVCGCFDPSFMRNCMEPISYIQWTFRLFSLPTSLASSDLKSSTLMTSTCKQNRNINHLSLFKEKLCFCVFLFKWWVNWRCDTSLKEDATFEFAFALGLNLNLNTKMWHRKGRLEKRETGIRNRNGNRNRNRKRNRNGNRNGKRNLYINRDNIYLNLS